ncbi:MAG: periplasmic sensor signal transduction histidine kinase [Acidimicrobiaceae bacterium]|jgi:signal transduction histidine kinase|nr:periplasmic sensor signal transduction histidine kinase [Acidimicrobiaceae bacterium]
MATRAPRWLTRFRGEVHLPRTVRMRLTLLCGGVILVSGGALLGIAFALGGSGPSQQNVSFIARQVGAAPFVPSGQSVPPGATVTQAGGHSSGTVGDSRAGGLEFVRATQTAVRISASNSIHDLLLWSIVGLGVVTAIGLALGWGLSGRMLRPLRTMRSTTQHISEENLHERLALAGPAGDELKDLGDTIDGLLGRLEAAFEAQRRFVQNAAHELRTPITMMRTSLEVATGKPVGAPPEVTVLAGKLGEGLDQAERLLEGFLALARAQAGAVADRAPIALCDVVTAAIAERADEIGSLGLTVEHESGAAAAMGSATLVPQIVSNLIDNAIRHNEAGGWVRIVTESASGTVRLVVENGGARVDQALVDELGQPFHRLVDRTASERGAGLGLSIVAAIVGAEGGTVVLEAREAGGLRVTVELATAERFVPAGSR